MIPGPRLREHAVLSLIFLLSRAALYAAGVRFNFALDWMWLSDPADLRGRLLETLYYFHAFPPGMNLLTGIMLKLGGADAATLGLAMFWLLGLVLVNALFHLCRVSGLSTTVALGVAVAFSLLPQSIFFEHLYLYEYPVAASLAVAAVLFHAAVRRQSSWAWFGFFLVCSVIGLTRSTFHLVWFAAMGGLALWFAGPQGRGRVLRAVCVPGVLLLALYVKNLALFGTFDAFTFGPVNLSLVTTWRLPTDVRAAWIDQGRLSPFAAVGVDAGPREYLPRVSPAGRGDWPEQLTRLDRPTVNAPNFNHWLFLDVNRRRRADALHYVAARPLDYAATVWQGVRALFAASTEWHPRDATGGSPHEQHRRVLGRYETVFNRVVHGLPVAPMGVYAFLPLVIVWAGLRARSLVRAVEPDARALGSLLCFCLFQIGFVVLASSAFTFRESARYRFQIEAMIWLVTAMCLAGVGPRRALRLATEATENAETRSHRSHPGTLSYGPGSPGERPSLETL